MGRILQVLLPRAAASSPVSLLPDTAQLETLLGEEPRLRALAQALLADLSTADDVVQDTLEQGARYPVSSGATAEAEIQKRSDSR